MNASQTNSALMTALPIIVLLAQFQVAAVELSPPAAPDRWAPWSARLELAPITRFSENQWLIEAGNGPSFHGGWDLEWKRIQPGGWYKVSVSCQPSNISSIHDQVAAELIWWDAAGKRAEWKHISFQQNSNGTLQFATTSQAPTNAVSATLRLLLRWTDAGKIAWRDARLEPTGSPPSRLIKVAIATGKFPGTSVEANVEFARTLIGQAADAGAKVVCLPECITTWRLKESADEGARQIPGPETDALCEIARRREIDVVCSMKEKNGTLVHNTGLYIDSQTGIVGKYRKAHLSVGERWKGITPGSEFPVWEASWGRAGMLICYDNVHAEAHRILSQKGAEIIFLPIMGDPRAVGEKGFEKWRQIMSVRAMDNHVWFVVCQNKGDWGMIVRPDGKVVGTSGSASGLAIAEIDLNFRHHSWIGSDFENRNWGERRPNLYRELIEDR